MQSVAAQLFASSIFPYAAFLYFLSKSKKTPGLALFGFYFLLVFVFATIPAGIYGEASQIDTHTPSSLANEHSSWWTDDVAAKTKYGTILANVDYLHGSAESLLTITNLLIGESWAVPEQGRSGTLEYSLSVKHQILKGLSVWGSHWSTARDQGGGKSEGCSKGRGTTRAAGGKSSAVIGTACTRL